MTKDIPTIRLATIADLESVQKLNAELFKEESQRDPALNLNWSLSEEGKSYYTKRLEPAGKQKACFVVEAGEEIIGYIVGSIHEKVPTNQRLLCLAELENMYILKEYRGAGIGTRLVDELKKWAKVGGATEFAVSAYTANVDAVAFYRRQGFSDQSITLKTTL